MEAPVGTVGKRRKYMHGDRTIYEWEQALDEVNIYFAPPPGLRAAEIDCVILPHHLKLGIKGNPPFLDVRRLHGKEQVCGDPSRFR